MIGTSAEKVIARTVSPHDIESVIELVRSDDFAREHSPETLRRLFSYTWASDKPSLGFVLAHGDRVVGFIGAIYSDRRIGGRSFRMCNLSTLCLHPDYRFGRQRGSASRIAYSHVLIEALISSGDLTFTAFSASRTAGHLLKRLGFEQFCERKRIFRPGANLGTLLSGPAMILDTPERILPELSGEHQTLLRDHLPYACGHYLVLEGGRYSYIVTRPFRIRRSVMLGDWPMDRIRKEYFLGSDILYLSNPEIAFRRWEQLKWRIMRRERTVALLADEWMLGPEAPGGGSIPRTAFVYGRKMEPKLIDKLYSEFVLLPS